MLHQFFNDITSGIFFETNFNFPKQLIIHKSFNSGNAWLRDDGAYTKAGTLLAHNVDISSHRRPSYVNAQELDVFYLERLSLLYITREGRTLPNSQDHFRVNIMTTFQFSIMCLCCFGRYFYDKTSATT